jgi:radical SAM-linked protein
MFKQRVLLQISIKGDIRFVSHHDLMKVLGRAARRAGLPVARSEGFNPRQKISLLLARGVGVASECEYAEIDLTDWVSVEEIARRLNENLPEGLRVERVVVSNPRERRQVMGIDYRVDSRTVVGVTDDAVKELLSGAEVWVDRERKKTGEAPTVRRVNIRPYIRGIRVGERSVEMSLVVSAAGTTRPEEVWKALGLLSGTLLADCTITRTGMELSAAM